MAEAFLAAMACMVIASFCCVLCLATMNMVWVGRGAFWAGNGNLIAGVTAAHTGAMTWPLSAVVAGICYWLWWKFRDNGKTKRRLKAFLRKFKGVRRTAPVTT